MADKPISCVALWVEGDIPEGYDWSAALPDGVALVHNEYEWEKSVRVKTFPWKDVYHEVQWWITRPMTFDEWVKLDDAETEVLGKILGDDFMGTAGPIPLRSADEAE